MGTTLKFFFGFLLMSFSISSIAIPFQQDLLAKESFGNNYRGPLSGPNGDTVMNLVRDTSYNRINTKLKIAAARLKQKANEARTYLTKNGFNDVIVFMVDMSIPSGKNRFFVYNLKKDSVEFTALVSHGSGSWKPNCDDQLVFSNLPNSNATSLGRYKIGNSYYGTYGLSYKLHGLDSTNNNAFQRAIVLHSDSYVPEKETFPRHIYQSAGCPIVSPSFLTVLGKYVKQTGKPMMLWVYN